MASSDSQIDKPQRGRPKRAELPDVHINTGAQSINTERVSLILGLGLGWPLYQAFVSSFGFFNICYSTCVEVRPTILTLGSINQYRHTLVTGVHWFG